MSEQVSDLVKGELELARTELTTKARRAGAGAGLMSAGGLLACYGLAVLLAAAIAALALIWPVWLAAVVVGIVVLVLAGLAASQTGQIPTAEVGTAIAQARHGERA